MKNPLDLRLNLPLNRKKDIEQLIQHSSMLGFKSIGVPIPPNRYQNLIDWLSVLCQNSNLDLITRLDLTPKSPQDLVKDLRRLRRRYELISVSCRSKSVARLAARDHRVDLLVFPSTRPRDRYFDSAEAKLATQSSAALEIRMAPLLRNSGFHRMRLLTCLRREASIAKKFKVPIVVCSDAQTRHELRAPHELTCLTSLFGLDSELARKSLTSVPRTLVKRNREKLDQNYVAKGVRIIRRSKNP